MSVHPNKSSKPPELGFCCAGDAVLALEEPHRLAIVFSLSISAIVFFPAAAGDLLPPADESDVFHRSSNPPRPPPELLDVVAGCEAAAPKLPDFACGAVPPPNAPNAGACCAGLVGGKAGDGTAGRCDAAGTASSKSKTLPPAAGLADAGAGAGADVGAAWKSAKSSVHGNATVSLRFLVAYGRKNLPSSTRSAAGAAAAAGGSVALSAGSSSSKSNKLTTAGFAAGAGAGAAAGCADARALPPTEVLPFDTRAAVRAFEDGRLVDETSSSSPASY